MPWDVFTTILHLNSIILWQLLWYGYLRVLLYNVYWNDRIYHRLGFELTFYKQKHNVLLCTLGYICLCIKILYAKFSNHKWGNITLPFLSLLWTHNYHHQSLFVRHIFWSGIFIHLEFIEHPYISFLWFLVWVTFFTTYHVDVIISEGYPGWLFLQTCRPSTGCPTLVWEDSLDFHLMGLCRYCCCIHG